jgi:hypothetical protein
MPAHFMTQPAASLLPLATEVVAAYWRLNLVASEDLPMIAAEMLSRGLDSRSLRVLAGEKHIVMSEAAPLLEAAFAELKIEIPSQKDAARIIARHYAGEALRGTLKPYQAASRIAEIYYLRDPEELESLSNFPGLAYQYEDFLSEWQIQYYGEEYCRGVLKETDAHILAEAELLLSSEVNDVHKP